MWPWSRNSERGSATDADLMLAPPGGIVRVALNLGWAPRLVPPKRRKASFGLKARSPQLPTWKGEEAAKSESSAVESRSPPTPVISPSSDIFEQLVGLIVVSGLSNLRRMSLALRITPCRIV